MKTQTELIADATVIKNETVKKANTATRVGTQLTNMAKALVPVIGYDASGTNSYTVTVTDDFTSYVDKAHFKVKFENANTGAATLNVNGLGAKNLRKCIPGVGFAALDAGDIQDGQILEVAYDGTNFQIIGGGVSGGASAFIVRWTFDDNGGNFPTTPNRLYIAQDAHGVDGEDDDYVAPKTWFVPIVDSPSDYTDFEFNI